MSKIRYVRCETQEQWVIVNANIPQEYSLPASRWLDYRENSIKATHSNWGGGAPRGRLGVMVGFCLKSG